MEEEDEEFDCKSTIGQLIQNVQKLCKKPQIDDQLSSALETFQENVTRQKAYLNNGIFNINFAEAAIFLQSCTELYGKRVDMLWDELLEFHTRLIEYDCHHDKERGKTLDQDAINKLEERRNRYKRKKKFKLALEQDKNKLYKNFLFETEETEPNIVTNECFQAWKEVEHESSLITRIPKSVYKQQLLKYRIKNYRIMRSEDFDINDAEDGEFNTKYSRIPGWHVIEHIFEYNTKGLLPDKNNVIATLRLSCYLRLRFMKDNNIPFHAPYSQYKDQYLAFKKKFFEEEAKKWQNMPLNTIADLRRQFEYLAKMEKESERKKETYNPWLGVSQSILNASCDVPDFSESTINISDSEFDEKLNDAVVVNIEKLPQDIFDKTRQDSGYFELEDSGMESANEFGTSLVENSKETSLEKEDETSTKINEENVTANSDKQCSDSTSTTAGNPNENTDILNNTENAEVDNTKKNTSVANTTEDVNSLNITPNNDEQCNDSMSTAAVIPGGNSDIVNNTENVEVNNTGDDTAVENATKDVNNTNVTSKNNEQCSDSTSTAAVIPDENTGFVNNTENVEVNNTGEDIAVENVTEVVDSMNESVEDNGVVECDNDDALSIMSDHDYCGLPDRVRVLKENKNVTNKIQDVLDPWMLKSKVVQRLGKVRVAKENRPKIELMGPPASKRRKLSHKQIEKLMQSKIDPVKEMKFEKFFSLNYQPQMGEGEVQEIDYESGAEAEDITKVVETPNNDDGRAVILDHSYCQSAIPASPVHDNDDVRSVISDHSYCQLLDDTVTEDNQLSVNDTVTEDNQLSVNDTVTEDNQLSVNDTFTEDNHLSVNDSGFVDNSLEHNLSMEASQEPPVNLSNPLLRGLEPEDVEEYERLIAQIREERRNECEELNILPEDDLKESERRKQELLESKARVEEWRQTITPILNNLKENEFDIHEYGGKIMEGMEIGETRLFKNVVDGKSSAEVVRYFIASLQLANTYNIEICGAKRGEMSNDTYSVKLLNKDRYHEHLTDYHAPSEDTFQERIKRMRALQNSGKMEIGQSLNKRPRIDKTPSKRRRKISSSDDDFEPLDASTPASSSENRVYSSIKRPKRSSGSNVIVDTVNCNTPSTSGTYSLPHTIEHFESELTAVQQTNPGIQMYSTPISEYATKTVEPNLLNQRVLFQ